MPPKVQPETILEYCRGGNIDALQKAIEEQPSLVSSPLNEVCERRREGEKERGDLFHRTDRQPFFRLFVIVEMISSSCFWSRRLM